MELEAHLGWVYIAVQMVIDRADDTLRVRASRCHRRTEVMCKGGDAALPWDEVADECDLTAGKHRFHINE